MKAILLGETVPNFTAPSTEGEINLHDYLGSSWGILFSHPKDFTPVCTTELGRVAKMKADFEGLNTKVLALSVDGLESHNRWIQDINRTQGTTVNFPIIADEDRTVSELYGMIHPSADNTLTVRSVFIIDPEKKLRLTLTYPASTGRNFNEIVRVLKSLQLTDHHKVATPENWNSGEECVIVPSITDPQEIKERFPKGHHEVTPYLRMTPQPD
ncbi:Peroxiredoxin-like protein DDB_G0282517, mitochondrial [Chlamydiales bacterium SCGC AG-110-M15]|nr:Peroxiredoxin-like protein DDB_G0282517, mitochondrial [Chlamydiales bacterium SCGC AG-110-M15]